jgi:hypothetical protein
VKIGKTLCFESEHSDRKYARLLALFKGYSISSCTRCVPIEIIKIVLSYN